MRSIRELLGRRRNLKKIYSFFEGIENPDESMGDLIVDAIETGIGYWCELWPDVKGKSEFYSERVWEAVKAGYVLEFGSDDDKGTLSLSSIVKGLDLVMRKYPRYYTDIKEENYDAISADVFFQSAIFGEVIFG